MYPHVCDEWNKVNEKDELNGSATDAFHFTDMFRLVYGGTDGIGRKTEDWETLK